MHPAHIVEITTPKKYLLNGILFGAPRPKRAIIWIHGLASSAFSKIGIIDHLTDTDTAVLTFNNRGYGTANRLRKINPKKEGGIEYIFGGGAHEVFTECVDDIEGAVQFARSQGAKEIYLAGHSTGCQKSVYYATRKGNAEKIKGVILLAPISDYAAALHFDKQDKVMKKQLRAAHKLMEAGTSHALVPGSWMDAQRFLSLNTPESVEEIFSYASPALVPRTYRALTLPTLVLFSEIDEYRDRPVQKIGEWFAKESRSSKFTFEIIPDADHGFHPQEKFVAKTIRTWIGY